MLSKDEELRLAGLLEAVSIEIAGGPDQYAPTLGDIKWMAEKLKELNDELKLTRCTGEESHRHWSRDSRNYITHTHPHTARNSVDFNIFHHHPPEDHRKSNG